MSTFSFTMCKIHPMPTALSLINMNSLDIHSLITFPPYNLNKLDSKNINTFYLRPRLHQYIGHEIISVVY